MTCPITGSVSGGCWDPDQRSRRLSPSVTQKTQAPGAGSLHARGHWVCVGHSCPGVGSAWPASIAGLALPRGPVWHLQSCPPSCLLSHRVFRGLDHCSGPQLAPGVSLHHWPCTHASARAIFPAPFALLKKLLWLLEALIWQVALSSPPKPVRRHSAVRIASTAKLINSSLLIHITPLPISVPSVFCLPRCHPRSLLLGRLHPCDAPHVSGAWHMCPCFSFQGRGLSRISLLSQHLAEFLKITLQ